MLMANQAGWVLCSPAAVEAVWLGGDAIDQLRVSAQAGNGGCPAASHFGHGILTWIIPFLFRTPPGYNLLVRGLLVRGPANAPEDGIAALEGLVETDWAMSTFTMNWKVPRPDTPIRLKQGEPIRMLVPQRRGELEAFAPAVIELHDAAEIGEHYQVRRNSRRWFNAQLKSGLFEERWQKHYVPVEPGDGAQPPGDRGPRSPSCFQVPGEAFDIGAADREQVQGGGTAPGGELTQVQCAGVAGQAAVAGQEPGEGEPFGVGEGGLDRGERSGWGGSDHRVPPGRAEAGRLGQFRPQRINGNPP